MSFHPPRRHADPPQFAPTIKSCAELSRLGGYDSALHGRAAATTSALRAGDVPTARIVLGRIIEAEHAASAQALKAVRIAERALSELDAVADEPKEAA